MSNPRPESGNLSDTSACLTVVAAACPDHDSEWEDIDSDGEPMRSSLTPTPEELACRQFLSDKSDAGKNNTGSRELLATSPKQATAAGRDSSCIKYEMVRNGGPNGIPVFDELGYQLDYYKVTGSAYGSRSSMLGKSRYKSENQLTKEEHRKGKIMGTPRNNVSALTLMAWKERVSRDLGIPYHTVIMEDFEEWQERGFVAEPGEFEAVNISKEKRDMIDKLATGSAYRK